MQRNYIIYVLGQETIGDSSFLRKFGEKGWRSGLRFFKPKLTHLYLESWNLKKSYYVIPSQFWVRLSQLFISHSSRWLEAAVNFLITSTMLSMRLSNCMMKNEISYAVTAFNWLLTEPPRKIQILSENFNISDYSLIYNWFFNILLFNKLGLTPILIVVSEQLVLLLNLKAEDRSPLSWNYPRDMLLKLVCYSGIQKFPVFKSVFRETECPRWDSL